MIYNQNQLISNVFFHVFILLPKAIKAFRLLSQTTNAVYPPIKKDLFLKHINLQGILYVHVRLFPKHSLQPGNQQYLHPNKMLADRGLFEFTMCAFKTAVRI